MGFRPKYISFDGYDTLTRFRVHETTREIFADRTTPEKKHIGDLPGVVGL
ncbi:hypothetical protein [Pseudoxanthomonas wuyuanensis]